MKLMVIKITLSTDADLTETQLETLCDKLNAMVLPERLRDAALYLVNDEPTLMNEATIGITVEE